MVSSTFILSEVVQWLEDQFEDEQSRNRSSIKLKSYEHWRPILFYFKNDILAEEGESDEIIDNDLDEYSQMNLAVDRARWRGRPRD